jgi:hypothetical protein
MAGVSDSPQNFDDFMADLLCLCVFDPNGRVMTLEEANKLPMTTQQELFDMALRLSGISKPGQEEVKNLSGGNMGPG